MAGGADDGPRGEATRARRYRYLALHDLALPIELLSRLAIEPDSGIRRGVARHPMADDQLLAQLLTDPDPNVVDDAAANPVLPRERMYRILAEAGI